MGNFVVITAVSGITLEGIDELCLGRVTLVRNPAAVRYGMNVGPEGITSVFPNILIPERTKLGKAPKDFYFHRDVRLHGISNWLLIVEMEVPETKIASGQIQYTVPAGFVKEELKWALLPLRLATTARVLAGISPFQQGGGEAHGSVSGGILEDVRREGLLSSAPEIAGVSRSATVSAEKATSFSGCLTKLSEKVDKHREALSLYPHTKVAIDNFSDSFALPFSALRAMTLLWALESLFCEDDIKGRNGGFKDKVVSRGTRYLENDMQKRTGRMLAEAYDLKKPVEHGRRGISEVETDFAPYVEQIEDLVRNVLFRAVKQLEAGGELLMHFPNPNKAFVPKRD